MDKEAQRGVANVNRGQWEGGWYFYCKYFGNGILEVRENDFGGGGARFLPSLAGNLLQIAETISLWSPRGTPYSFYGRMKPHDLFCRWHIYP